MFIRYMLAVLISVERLKLECTSYNCRADSENATTSIFRLVELIIIL